MDVPRIIEVLQAVNSPDTAPDRRRAAGEHCRVPTVIVFAVCRCRMSVGSRRGPRVPRGNLSRRCVRNCESASDTARDRDRARLRCQPLRGAFCFCVLRLWLPLAETWLVELRDSAEAWRAAPEWLAMW